MALESISEAEYARWLKPHAATSRIIGTEDYIRDGTDPIFRRLKAGLIRAVAELALWYDGISVAGVRTQYVILAPAIWSKFADGPPPGFWKDGDADVVLGSDDGYTDVSEMPWVSLIGVRFDPVGVAKLVDGEEGSASEDDTAPAQGDRLLGRRGAKRKDWWDHLWIEMIRRIDAGTLAPSGPTELQRDMLEWLETQGIFPGVDTVKRTASNLFRYLEKRRGN